MPETSTNLILPYIQPSQAQKHVTHNEGMQVLDAVVQLSVVDRDLSAPPPAPVDGSRYIVAAGASGAWAGWSGNIVYWIGGGWLRLQQRVGWLAWVADEAVLLVWNGAAWAPASAGGAAFSDAVFTLADDLDPTKTARFELAGNTTGTARTYAVPDFATELAGLAGVQTFTGAKTFSGTVTATNTVTTTGAVNASGIVTASGTLIASGNLNATGTLTASGNLNATGTLTASGNLNATGTLTASGPLNATGTLTASGNLNATGTLTASNALNATGTLTSSGAFTASGSFSVTGPAATVGSSSATATYGVGTGATLTATTKTLNLGTGGVSGSTTVVNIGSATAGALGSTVVNTPTVTFANTVTAVGMPQANLTTLYAGIGGATADVTNRLSVNTPAILLNNAGTSIEATVNKAAAANDAAIAFKTGFSTRALLGLLANDDFSFKVSANGSTYSDALRIDRTTGRVEVFQPVQLTGVSAAPVAPVAGKLGLYARIRTGLPQLDVQRATGRDFTVQPHIGLVRTLRWLPSNGTSITTEGSTLTSVGTVSTPAITTTTLLGSMRRFRLTSAALVDSVADIRSPNFICFRGAAAGLGGFNFISRISLQALQVTGMGFFGLHNSSAAFATTTTLASLLSTIGIGYQRGTHTNWQLVTNDAVGAPTLTDLGASFAIATGGLLTLTIAAVPNAASIWVRVVDDVTGAVFEQEVTTDLVPNTTLLSPRMFMNNGATAAAVAFESAGLHIETDY